MSISAYIKEDVIAGIFSGRIAPGALTLDELSQRYQVSATPVRAAVRELVKEGILQRDANRRLVVRDDCTLRFVAPPEQPKDYHQLVSDDLVKQSLRGEPVLVREETMAEKYGISRSTIRQIFNRLAGDGVLKHLPRRGWQLRPFREADLDAYIEMREILELKALALAWPRLVDEDIQRMIDLHHMPTSDDDAPLSDNSLHGYLITKANNRYVADFFERHGKFFTVLFDWEMVDRQAAIQTVREHLAILQALLCRDRAAAEPAMIEHIRNNHTMLRNLVRSHANPTAEGLAPSDKKGTA